MRGITDLARAFKINDADKDGKLELQEIVYVLDEFCGEICFECRCPQVHQKKMTPLPGSRLPGSLKAQFSDKQRGASHTGRPAEAARASRALRGRRLDRGTGALAAAPASGASPTAPASPSGFGKGPGIAL